ncbi:hypothetical protein SSP35_04_04840 [Streptomyces sp. NBRC 110611]|uniref:hypothetical protein n=1 Tax=Streptomyces sp. NBRC 110611 TaxID=1621259 RepID=UPI0008583752|nr:hypothetical protein [Streptomyces sp. NBRC 110611]GAU67394.1 hypothetical protein SSP35_04_04840 [Streptomyces sp. NBRC 110611]
MPSRPARAVLPLPLLLTLLTPLALVTGCAPATAGQRPAAKEADVPAAPAVGEEARRLVLPFDAYAMSTPAIHTVESAEDVLIRGCMQAQGMSWKALPRPSGVDQDPPNRRRYGLVEADIAARFGYHLPPEPPELTRRAAAWDERKNLPDREQLAAFGRQGGGGCWKKAHDGLLRGITPADQSLFNRRIGEEFSASKSDPEVVRVIRGWSACMRENGFRYSSPLKVTGDAEWGKSSRPARREIAVARADIRCKERTDLVPVWSGVEARMQNDVIRRHAEDFRVLKAEKDRWLAAARRVLDRE